MVYLKDINGDNTHNRGDNHNNYNGVVELWDMELKVSRDDVYIIIGYAHSPN